MKKIKKENNTSLLSKIILTLYLIVGLSPKVVEIEYEGFQWFYFSILNIVSLVYVYVNKELLLPFSIGKKASRFFMVFLLFLIVVLISISQAFIVSESLVHIARLVNVIVAVYVVFTFVKNNPKDFFQFVGKVCLVLLAYQSFVTLEHYIGNFTMPRNRELYKTFLHYYGNINIFTASIIVKLPFVIYLFTTKKNLVWKYISGVVIFISVLSLYFSGSRTALLSMILIFTILTIYNIIKAIKSNEKRVYIINSTYLFLVPILALFLMLNVNRVDKNKMNTLAEGITYTFNDYKKVDNFIANNKEVVKTPVVIEKQKLNFVEKLLQKSGRSRIWKSAYQAFISNPILGVGYGNYKIYPHKDYFLTKVSSRGGFSKPIRVHNDFFEKFVETGIIGGVLYILLFVLIFIIILSQQKTKYKEEIFFLFLAGLVYSIDAFLNFPLERVPIQLFFVLIAAFVLAFNYHSNKDEQKNSSIVANLFIPITLITILSAYSNYLVFKAYSVNTAIKNEKTLKKRGDYKFTFNEMNSLINNYPALDQDGIKMKYYLATFAAKEKKYQEALDILTEASDPETYDFLLKKQKGEIFLKGLKNLDSAQYYFKEVFDVYPAYRFNYSMLRNIYKGKNEIDNYEKTLNRYTNINNKDFKEWIEKAQYYYRKNKDISLGISILDTALAYNSKSLPILDAKKKLLDHKKVNNYVKKNNTKEQYDEVIAFYNKGKFSEAKKILQELLKNNPKDHFAVMYIGIMELSLKNYESGVKYLTESINLNIFKDGKAEYCRALCYQALGKKEEAKEDYRAARAKKFPQAMSLPESKYK